MKRSVAAAAFAALWGAGCVGPARAATLALNLTADNQFAVYVSTSDDALGTLVGSGNDWRTTYAFSCSLAAGPYFIHVIAANWTPQNGSSGSPATEDGTGDNPDGFIGAFSIAGGAFANGSTTLSTDTTNWKASEAGARPYATIPATWTGATGAPQSYGLNGVGPWGGRPDIASGAQWIWSNPDNGQYAEFSTAFTAAPEASTWAMMACGFAALGFAAFRRPRKPQPASIVG